MAAFILVAKLTTRWRHLHQLQILPPDGATCISYKVGHQMAPLAFVTKLAARWHFLHCFQISPPNGTTGFSCNFGHLMAPLALNPLEFIAKMALLALVQNLTTRLTGWVTCIATLPWIVLLALSVSIGLVSPSARVTSVEFQKRHSLTNRTHRSDPRDTWVR